MKKLTLTTTFCKYLLKFLNWLRKPLLKIVPDTGCPPEIIIDPRYSCVVKFDARLDKLSQIEYKVDTLMSSRQIFLDSNLTLESLAKEAGTNRTYLARMFREKKNVRFEQYITGLRLKYACEMAYRDLDVV